MENYYINKIAFLLKSDYTESEALYNISNIYLDSKPRKFIIKERNEQFWLLLKKFNFSGLLDNELFVLCLVKGLKENYIFNHNFIQIIIDIDKRIFINALRYSKIFLIPDNENFTNIKNYYIEKKIEIDFFLASDVLINKFKVLEENKNRQINRIKEYGYLDLICTISLLMMKNMEKNIDFSTFQMNGNILTKIIHDRLKFKDKKKGRYTNINESFTRVFKMIKPKESYEDLNRLEDIIRFYKELYLFEENVLSTFCFDNNFKYKIKDKVLELNVLNKKKYKNWLNNGKKLEVFYNHYFNDAIKESMEVMNENIFGSKENDEINKIVFCQTRGIYNLLKDIYGIDDNLNISDSCTIPLFKSIHEINSLAGLYQSDFIPKYKKLLNDKKDWNYAWKEFLNYGLIKGKQRMPIVVQEQYQFSKNINNGDPSINKVDRNNIESFYSFDLKKANENNEEKIPNIFEKPLLQLDDLVFIMPFVLGLQNSATAFINNLLNVHFKRNKYRNEEVHRSETNLSKLFEKLNFKVESNYELPLSEEYDVGDIDLICQKDNHLFVLELKSTYIRTSFENIWNYKSKALRKATYQLNKRNKLITKLQKENNKEFRSQFSNFIEVHYLIIDTSFEFDHELFEDKIKISMFELINLLNEENEELYPNGFKIDNFIDNIKSGMFWESFIDKDISFDVNDINYKISI